MILQQYPFPEEEEEEANRVFGSGSASVDLQNFKEEVVADQRLKQIRERETVEHMRND
jgi:hypothetical protein